MSPTPLRPQEALPWQSRCPSVRSTICGSPSPTWTGPRAFYTELLGFQIAMDAPPPADDPHHGLATDLLQGGIVMVNGDLLLGLRRWTPSGPRIVSTRSAAAWTT